MEFDQVNTTVPKCQGNVGVARAIYEYTRLGYTVLVPFSDSDKYDLVIDAKDILLRVQVKTSRCKTPSGRYSVELRTKGGNSRKYTSKHLSSDSYDLLFVLIETGDCWSIPSSIVGTSGNLIVGGDKYDKYKLGVVSR